jgi:hypothetical protein
MVMNLVKGFPRGKVKKEIINNQIHVGISKKYPGAGSVGPGH